MTNEQYAGDVANMRNHSFRSGWLETDLRSARDAMAEAVKELTGPRHSYLRERLQRCIEAADRTLKIIEQATAQTMGEIFPKDEPAPVAVAAE